MLLKNAIEEINGLRFMIDKLDIQSSWAKRILLDSPYLHSAEEINTELNKVEQTCQFLNQAKSSDIIDKICLKLMQTKNIRGTIKRIFEQQNLDDIELFEIKTLALAVSEIRDLLQEGKFNIIRLPDLEAVINLLDPEGMRVPYFYVYDAYSKELAILRKKIKNIQMNPDAHEEKLENLQYEHTLIEDRIREELSIQIQQYKQEIKDAFQNIAVLDILIAKGKQVIELGLQKPNVAQEITTYKKIFNPQVQDALSHEGKKYQPIDIRIEKKACLISGANMAGKSVILRTVALAQALFQFGFYIPAEEAEIALVDKISLCIGDEQNELKGLSSYASEILRINTIIQEIKAGKEALVLIDELARTTNPEEGKAIVNAVLEFMTTHHCRALITSHYSGIKANCNRLRVKGFIKDKVNGVLNVNNINEYIDYSLVEDTGDNVPQGATRIARMLGVDEELLDKVEQYMEQ